MKGKKSLFLYSFDCLLEPHMEMWDSLWIFFRFSKILNHCICNKKFPKLSNSPKFNRQKKRLLCIISHWLLERLFLGSMKSLMFHWKINKVTCQHLRETEQFRVPIKCLKWLWASLCYLITSMDFICLFFLPSCSIHKVRMKANQITCVIWSFILSSYLLML